MILPVQTLNLAQIVGGAAFGLALFAGAAEAIAAPCDVKGALQGTVRDLADASTVKEFYRIAGQSCAWDERSARGLASVVERAAEHGLDPALFQVSDVVDSGTRADGGAERDIFLTDAAITYALSLSRGLSAAPIAREDAPAKSHPNGELVRALFDALSSGNLPSWLEGLAPKSEPYRRLKEALATYRSLAENGGWAVLPAKMPKKGARKATFVRLLRERLALEGDLNFDDGSDLYNGEVRAAVRRFQARNGLGVDGKMSAKTIERLNVSAAERVAQISLNMERHRASLRDLPQTRVEVNAAGATAALYRDGAPTLTMNAVVGAPGHDTPTLSSKITTIVLNPPWVIPQSIIHKEIKPLLKRRPDYLTENRMYWSGDNLIQEPGPHNALGHIKFEFPNRYSVYLHDTPARKLFLTPERAQSHGCVRLEKPLELAEELLREDSEWTREAVEEAIRQGDTQRVTLSEPMPVVITYQTVFVDEEGLVNFRPDIYGSDTQLTLAVAQRVAALGSAPAAGEF